MGKSISDLAAVIQRSIDVYVRKAADARVLSLTLPADIPQEEAIQRGFAFDGNAVIAAVTPYTTVRSTSSRSGTLQDTFFPWEPEGAFEAITTYPLETRLQLKQQGETLTLADALRDVQQMVVRWLGSHGYKVVFK